MKSKWILFAVLCTTAWTAGCKQTVQPEPNVISSITDTNPPLADLQWQNVKESATNAWQSVKQGTTNAWENVKEGSTQAWAQVKESLGSTSNYTYEKKSEFVTNAQADLNALDLRMKDLSNEATNATSSAKVEAQEKIQDLRIKQAQLNQKLDDVKNASAAQWQNVKTDFKSAYSDMTNSMTQAWQW